MTATALASGTSSARTRPRWRLVAVGALGAVGLLAGARPLLAAFAPSQGAAPAHVGAGAESSGAAPLSVHVVELQPVEGYTVARRFSGEVRAQATSLLAFEQAEPMVELNVAEGDAVVAGQVLARLDTAELEADLAVLVARAAAASAQLDELIAGPRAEVLTAARARVAELEQRLELAELTAARRRALVAGRHVPEESADEARFEAAAQVEALAAARANLAELENGTRPERIAEAEARLAEIEAAQQRRRTDLIDAELVAPFDGVIGAVRAELGSIPGPGTPVLELVQDADLEAWIGLPVEVCGRLENDSEHRLRLSDGRGVTGHIRSRLPRLDPATRTRTVLFRLDGVGLDRAVPGQRIDLELDEQVAQQGYWLPTTALVRSRRGLWAAYAVAPDSDPPVVERRELELLHTTGDRAFVRGLLQPGERVVRDGVQRLVDGQRIAPVEAAARPANER